jgi:hypothetical protein
VLQDLAAWLPEHGLALMALVASPIRGPAGNAEFLALIAPGPAADGSTFESVQALIEAALEQAHPTQQLESGDP